MVRLRGENGVTRGGMALNNGHRRRHASGGVKMAWRMKIMAIGVAAAAAASAAASMAAAAAWRPGLASRRRGGVAWRGGDGGVAA